jgi:hypothetical protein
MFAGREEMIEDNAYELDFDGAFSYMAIKGKIKAPEEEPRYHRGKKKKGETPEEKPKPETDKKWDELLPEGKKA